MRARTMGTSVVPLPALALRRARGGAQARGARFHHELRDDRVLFFRDLMQPGTLTYRYLARVRDSLHEATSFSGVGPRRW